MSRLMMGKTDFTAVERGAIHQTEWDAICRSMALAQESGDDGLLVEVGVLRGKTTAGMRTVAFERGWNVKIVAIDKADVRGSLVASLSGVGNTGGMPADVEFHCGTTTSYMARYWESPDACPPIRFAFVDGCHCQVCVEEDIRALHPATRVGTVLAFHDASDQHDRGMLVHERYHGDGVARLYGVTEAIMSTLGNLGSVWMQVELIPSQVRPAGSPTPIRGGLQAWKRID